MSINVNSPFVPRKTSKGRTFKHADIVEFEKYNHFHHIGEGEQDIVVEERIKESSRINRKDFINSHRDDVGIGNILRKVQMTGDTSLLDQRQRQSIPTHVVNGRDVEDVVDITKLPNNKMDAVKCVSTGVDAFDKLPYEIKKKMDLATFVKTISEDAIDKYIASKMSKQKVVPAKTGEGE